jgi:uncharacterized protein (DUF885 family)
LRVLRFQQHRALIDEARAKLGAKFDIKAFHDVVLMTGSVPLDVMAETVRQWTTARQKA